MAPRLGLRQTQDMQGDPWERWPFRDSEAVIRAEDGTPSQGGHSCERQRSWVPTQLCSLTSPPVPSPPIPSRPPGHPSLLWEGEEQ